MVDLATLFQLQGKLLLLTLLGFFLRRGFLGEGFQKGLTDFVLSVALPCSVLSAFDMSLSREMLVSSAVVMAVSLCLQLFCVLLAGVLYRRLPEEKQPALQYGTITSNAGFLGIPMAEGLLGAQGVLGAAFFLIPQRIFMWTVGVSYFTKAHGGDAWKKILLNPCIIATVAGLCLMLTHKRLPPVLGDTVRSLSGCSAALSMILIGMTMSDLRWRSLLDPAILLFSFLRLVVIPLVVLLGCRLCRVHPLSAYISVVFSCMPAGGTTAILAAKFERNPAFAAGCVTVSTVFSLLTIPVWCYAMT